MNENRTPEPKPDDPAESTEVADPDPPSPTDPVVASDAVDVECADLTEPAATTAASVAAPAPADEPAAVASIRMEKKHPLAIRWMHWINFPVLATMIWSGLLIYWDDSDITMTNHSQVYRIGIGSWTLFRFFPQWFWHWYNGAYRITVGLGYHFFFMWFFVLNGLVYVLYTWISGEWRYLVPTKNSFKDAIQVTLHDLGIRKEPLPHRKFNGAQQIAYTAVILMGFGSLVTGLAIYKPSQAHWITFAMGGYEMARWLHFWLTIGYCVFFVIHVSQVAKAGWNNFRAMVSGYEIVPENQPSYKPDR